MVILISIAFWSLTGLILWRLWKIVFRHQEGKGNYGIFAIWALLSVLALLSLMRPHEDILGGQDTGAYANMGARLGHTPKLLYQDSLLALVPKEDRHHFFYYDKNTMYPTKYGSGAVIDVDNAIAGNWFQPALAITMSLPAAIGGPKSVLYVTPIFTIFTAFALSALVTLLIQHRAAGIIIFFCFLSCPIVQWHARFTRPEIAASFLLFSGAVILLDAWRANKGKCMMGIAIGAVSISLAPLFHVIAWSPALIAAVIVGLIILSGRSDFLIYPLIAALIFLVFILQITTVVDTYRLLRYVQPIVNEPYLSVGILLLGLILLGGISASGFTQIHSSSFRHRIGRILVPLLRLI